MAGTQTVGGRFPAGLIFLSSLMMVAGVASAAAAAHAGAGREMATAALMLLTHAPMLALVGVAIAVGLVPVRIGGAGALLALGGTGLFAADMVHRAMADGALFPMAAPIGGSADMIGWLIVGLAAAIRMFR